MTDFWMRVEKTPDCWLWRGSTDRHGYGKFHDGERSAIAHRVAYQLLVGPIPTGLTLDHLCRVKLCVNPDHLEPVTLRENLFRRYSTDVQRGSRYPDDECIHGHELTPENTIIRPRGGRRCRLCHRVHAAAWARRRRAAMRANAAP